MTTARSAAAACAAALLLAPTGAGAQDYRDSNAPAAWQYYFGERVSEFDVKSAQGFRLVHASVRWRGGQYMTIYVKNAGRFRRAWWWAFGKTAAEIDAFAKARNARIIMIKQRGKGFGARKWNALMVRNTGIAYKRWWWYHGKTADQINRLAAARKARITDIEQYGGKYAAIMIANAGRDARAWWWFTNTTPARINSFAKKVRARIYEIDKRGRGKYDVILVREPGMRWHWHYNKKSWDIKFFLSRRPNLRVVDLERGDEPGRFTVVYLGR